MRFLKVSLIILVLFITTSFPVTAGFDVAPWPMYQHDIFQNGSSPFPGPDGLSKELLKKTGGCGHFFACCRLRKKDLCGVK